MESDQLLEEAFCLFICLLNTTECSSILSKGRFLPRSLTMPGSIPSGQVQVQLPKLAARTLHSEGRAVTVSWTNSNLKEKYVKFLLGEKLNSSVLIQFHGSGVKSDRSPWPPLSIRWFAVQVSALCSKTAHPVSSPPLPPTAWRTLPFTRHFIWPPALAFIYQISLNIQRIN